MRSTTFQRHLILAIIIILAVLCIGAAKVAALTIGDLVSNVTPSGTQAPSTNSWHILIRSNHGNVDRVDSGMYFTDNTSDKQFKINVRGTDCGIPGKSTRASSNNYVIVEYPGGNHKFRGDKVCGNGSDKLDGTTFTIAKGNLQENYGNSTRWGVTVTVRWVDNTDKIDGVFNFRLNVTNGQTSYLEGATKNNSLVNHGSSNDDGYDSIYYPFGLDCRTTTAQSNQEVILYDADNGTSTQSTSVRFYIGTIDTNGNVTRLKEDDYTKENGNIWYQDTGTRKRDNGKPLWPEDFVSYDDGNIRFTPGNFNNQGGNSKVRIKSMQPGVRYVLVVNSVKAGQFIYVKLPGDGIFGSSGFKCENPTFTPQADITGQIGGEIEAGINAKAIASISNSGSTGTVAYTRHFWYDNGNGNYSTAEGDTLIGMANPVSGDVTIGNKTSVGLADLPTTVDGSRAYICTALALSNPRPPGIAKITKANDGACYKIVRKPFFKVYNGDANAAMAYCSDTGTVGSTIRALNNGATAYNGSGTSIAAFAAGDITGFASAMNSATKPKYLTFANNDSTKPYGGNGKAAIANSCIPDVAIGNDVAAGNVTIDSNINTKNHWEAKGDVYITANKTYAGFSLNSIPQFTVTATGDIYISADVTDLSGIFKAGGTIYTCATGVKSLPSTTAMTETCKKPLTVQGALIAKSLKLMRTTGTISQGAPAETIIFSPEVWLKSIVGTTPSSDPLGLPKVQLGSTYDSIVNLPPVL